MRTLGALLISVSVLVAPAAQAQPLKQAEWGRSLVDALGWSAALTAESPDPDVANLLSGKERIALPRSKGTTTSQDSNATTTGFTFEVEKPGAFLLKVYLGKGPAFLTLDDQPSILIKKANGGKRWTDAGVHALSAGKHSVYITGPDRDAPSVELIAGCNLIAPLGGWTPTLDLTFADKATTLVRAMGLQGRLPAGDPFTIPGKGRRRTLRVTAEGEFTVQIRTPASTSASIRIDGCQEMRPEASAANDGNWRTLGSLTLRRGNHSISLSAPGSVISQAEIRLIARNADGRSYIEVLEILGVREGEPSATVSPAAAKRNLDHEIVRAMLGGGSTADASAAATLPSDQIPDRWADPISPIRPRQAQP